MPNFVRQINGFSEFQLGKIQVWATSEKALVTITKDYQVIRVLRKNLTLIYWEYGEEPMISVEGELITLSEFKEEIAALSGLVSSNVEDAMKRLISTMSDLVGGSTWA